MTGSGLLVSTGADGAVRSWDRRNLGEPVSEFEGATRQAHFLKRLTILYVFKLAGWLKRAIIANSSQWVPKDTAAISSSLSIEDGVILIEERESLPY